MIDTDKRASRAEQKEKVRRRMRATVDPDNYEYIPAKKQTDYYDNDVPQRVGIYVRVSTDDIRQTTSYELQKKYYATGVGSLFLLQGIFPTQKSNPGLPHCRQILYQLSHKRSPTVLEVGILSLLQRVFD